MPELIKDPKEIKLNEHHEIQQVMGDPPRWITRWGISMVFLVTGLLFLLAYLVKYSDTVSAPITLQTENPPIRIPAPISAKIEKLFVVDGQKIKEGQLLAAFENTANVEDVEALKEFVEEVEKSGIVGNIKLPQKLDLGALQNSYSSFSENYKNYKYFLSKNKTAQKVQFLRQQIIETEDLNKVLEEQESSFNEELELGKEQIESNQSLYGMGAISKEEYQAHLIKLKKLERSATTVKSESIKNNIAIQQLQQQIVELGEFKDNTISDRLIMVEESFEKIKSDLKNWELSFSIKSPIDGIVSFSKPIATQEFMSLEEEMMTILPEGESKGNIIGLAQLPFLGAGKVEIGDTVFIRLNDYPYHEFGSIKAEVKSIAAVPQKNSYLVEVEIPKDFKTVYDKPILFRQQMTGTARIITEERRYLFRILDRVMSAWENQ